MYQHDNTCLSVEMLYALLTWAAWYNTWLLIQLMLKGVGFSSLFLSFYALLTASSQRAYHLPVAGEHVC
jgi:uncharacterized membrane protein